ncbi:MAG: DUF3344 domain-containing protein [Methanophagales archaeon]|nr:DUF3344 domain-containing protein [Methanophagales archaeon]
MKIKKINYLQASISIIAIIYVIMLCLTAVPVAANYNFAGWPVETRTNGTVNGGVFIGYEPWAGTTTLTGTFDVPNGTVKWARLYTGIWGGTENYEGWVNVVFNGINDKNRLGPIHLRGKNDINPNVWCSTHGKYWMWYNVTDLVNAGSINTATTSKINATVGGFDGRVYGIVLVVVYEGGDDPKDIQYWINDGCDALHYAYATWPFVAHDSGRAYFNGTVNTDVITKANLTVVHLTAYEPCCDSCLEFNSHNLNTSIVDSNTFELNSWNVTDYVVSAGNNIWYWRGDDHYINVANSILVLERGAVKKPDLIITAIKPYHYEWLAGYGIPKGEPWFNLMNYVNVTVRNNGTAAAGRFEVKLYDADDELIGSETVAGLAANTTTDVKIEWKPEGEDVLGWVDTVEGAKITHHDTSKNYTLRAVVDEDKEVLESSEGNNELIKEQKVVWNGFSSDEPLENYVHGDVKGGIIYTTGNGQYCGVDCNGTKYGTYNDVSYELEVPGDTKLARLYIYYTWSQPSYKSPKIGVTLNTPSGDVHALNMERSYNDIKGDFNSHRFTWGTYAFNITSYVNESGTYVVNITNLNDGSDLEFATRYALAAPGILVVYENATAPEREYWINEGADILLGGRRSRGGFLSLAECLNHAMFPGSLNLSEVENATLGVVSPWGGASWEPGMTNHLYFNVIELGKGVYCGYNSPCNRTVNGITMSVGANNAQVGVNVTDVTGYLNASGNVVFQGDDGDCMMPANAFLVLTYYGEGSLIHSPANQYPSIMEYTMEHEEKSKEGGLSR